MAAATVVTARIAPTHHGWPTNRGTVTTPTSAEPASEPARPSQDFLGLMRGAIGVRPKR